MRLGSTGFTDRTVVAFVCTARTHSCLQPGSCRLEPKRADKCTREPVAFASPYQKSLRAKTQNVLKWAPVSVRLLGFRAAALFELRYPSVWEGCQISVERVVRLLRGKPPSTVCSRRFPARYAWRTSADHLERPRVNTDVKNWRTANLERERLTAVATTKLSQGPFPDQGLEARLDEASKQLSAQNQWRGNADMVWICALLHACLYVDMRLTCDGSLWRGGLSPLSTMLIHAHPAPHWPWYPVRPTLSTPSPPPPPAPKEHLIPQLIPLDCSQHFVVALMEGAHGPFVFISQATSWFYWPAKVVYLLHRIEI